MQMILAKLFQYQAWANDELCNTLGTLANQNKAAELNRCLRLINHAFIVSRIFSAHLTQTAHEFTKNEKEEIPDIEELRSALRGTDLWYISFAQNVGRDDLSEMIPFTFTDGDYGCMSREEMLFHVLHHFTYHRGEIGTILRQASIVPPWDTFAVHLHQTDPSRRNH